MNMSPLQRKFVIKQRIYSISVTHLPPDIILRFYRYMGNLLLTRYYQCIYIQFTGKTVPDIYGPRQRRSNIHAYMGNSL